MMAVLVGLLQIELCIPGNRSLKGKRRVLNSVKERIRSQFNVSIAEVGLNDVWDAALLGVSRPPKPAPEEENTSWLPRPDCSESAT